MTKKKAVPSQLTSQEMQLIEQLRQNPDIMARVQSILDITRNAEGPLKSADEVEGLLIQEMRRLGKTTMNQWAAQAEERVVQELKEQDPTIRSRKKNAELVVRLWVGAGTRSDLAKRNSELCPSLTQESGSKPPRTLGSTGTGVDGLWLRAFLCQGR